MSQPLLSASNIVDAEDLKFVDVEVPEWGGTIRLKQMDAKESMAFTDEMVTIEKQPLGMYLMLIRCAVDEQGKKLFTDEDLPRLQAKSVQVLNRLQRIAITLNKMDQETTEVLKKD